MNAGLLQLPKVMVLMAAYNGRKWIEAQIESILAQVDVDVDLVVRDDGSEDGTINVLERYELDGKLTLLRSAKASGSAAQNFLALIRSSFAKDHSFIAISDQDDLWEIRKLSRAVQMLNESGAVAYSTWVEAFWYDGRRSVLKQSPRATKADFLFEGAGQGCTFVLTAAFFKTSQAFLILHQEKTGEIRYHDWLLYALSRCWRLAWVFDSVPMVAYRQHGQNDTGAKKSVNGVIKRLSLIRTGWYRRQISHIHAVCSATDQPVSVVSEWGSLSVLPDTPWNRIRKAKFLYKGGRRRKSDNVVLIFAAFLGWI